MELFLKSTAVEAWHRRCSAPSRPSPHGRGHGGRPQCSSPGPARARSALRLTPTTRSKPPSRAWTFWDRFEPGSNARAWLHRILVNTFINAYRKQRRERELFKQAGEEARREAHTAADLRVAEHDGLGDEVGAALGALPAEFRAVVELVDLRDLSYREVAGELECPIGTVMSRLHRARKQLQEMLADYAHNEGYVALAAQAAA
jgi:RNA polymerase sigma-70 factor (ECF subfamily)